MLLQAFYGIRSRRLLMERIEFDLLSRWFVGLGMDDPAWDHSSFTTNRDRLLNGRIAAKLLEAALAQPKVKQLLSSDHFSVDGTLIEAWASINSFRRKDGNDRMVMGPAATPSAASMARRAPTRPMKAQASRSRRMKGKWRITRMPDYEANYRDMMEPAYILFDGKGGGEFAFGCVTGAIYGAGDEKAKAVDFSWDGNDEMDSACGDGWAELRPDGSLKGQICFHGGDKADFTARPWKTSLTAC